MLPSSNAYLQYIFINTNNLAFHIFNYNMMPKFTFRFRLPIVYWYASLRVCSKPQNLRIKLLQFVQPKPLIVQMFCRLFLANF